MKKTSSKSAYIKYLTTRGKKNKDTGIELIDRQLKTNKQYTPNTYLDYLLNIFILSLFIITLNIYVAYCIGQNISYPIIMIITIVCSTFACYFYTTDLLKSKRRFAILLLLGFYLMLRFIGRNVLQSGWMQLLGYLALTLNQNYSTAFSVGLASGTMVYFWLAMNFWLAMIFGYIMIYRNDHLLFNLLFWPVFAVMIFISNGSINIPLVLLFISYGITMVIGQNRKKKRLWKNDYDNNYHHFLSIHRSLVIIGCVFSLLTVSFSMYMGNVLFNEGTLTLDLHYYVEGKIIEGLVNILPTLSAGEIQLQTKTIGGGVSDGDLENLSGVHVNSVDDLKITVDEKPTDTLYLKGYVGDQYVNHQWTRPSSNGFDNASHTWKNYKTNMDIINLSYLRIAKASKQQAHTMTIEKLSDLAGYTYYPYFSYLNDDYTVLDGDGAVASSQYEQDYISYYNEEDIINTLRGHNASNAFDELEKYYSSYVQTTYTKLPDGYSTLHSLIDEQHFKSDTSADKITKYIQDYLLSNYTYVSKISTKSSVDPIEQFINDKKGNNAQFVSTAVLMYRMCNIPARYVVGYVASENEFKDAGNGSYSAILKDKNAHIWVEIYQDGIGWTPVEVTPGTEVKDTSTTYKQEVSDTTKDKTNTTSNRSINYYFYIIAFISALVLVSIIIVLRYLYLLHRGLLKNKTNNDNAVNITRYFYKQLKKKKIDQSIEFNDPRFIEEVKKLTVLQEEPIHTIINTANKSYFSQYMISNEELNELRNIVFHK